MICGQFGGSLGEQQFAAEIEGVVGSGTVRLRLEGRCLFFLLTTSAKQEDQFWMDHALFRNAFLCFLEYVGCNQSRRNDIWNGICIDDVVADSTSTLSLRSCCWCWCCWELHNWWELHRQPAGSSHHHFVCDVISLRSLSLPLPGLWPTSSEQNTISWHKGV